MKFSSVFTLTTISTLIRVMSGLLINKLIAVFSGPAGLAIYGNFMSLNGLLSISGSGSSQTAITKLISSSNIKAEKISIVLNSLIIILTLLVFISLILLIFPTEISNYIFKDPSFKLLIYLSIPLMWSTVMNLTMLAILNGLKEFKTFSVFNMLIAAFPAILILIFSEEISIEKIVFSYLFSSILITFFLFINLFPFLKDLIMSSRFIQASKLSLIAKFGITSLVTGLIVTFSILIFRNMII